MKKYLTLANVMKAAAFLFGFIAFFMMFANQIYLELLGNRGYVKTEAMFDKDYGAWITFVGYLLILLASLCACALIFLGLDAKMNKMLALILSGVLILGAVFVFIEAAVVNGDSNVYHLAGGPIVAGIFAIIAGLALCASEFVPNKNLMK